MFIALFSIDLNKEIYAWMAVKKRSFKATFLNFCRELNNNKIKKLSGDLFTTLVKIQIL